MPQHSKVRQPHIDRGQRGSGFIQIHEIIDRHTNGGKNDVGDEILTYQRRMDLRGVVYTPWNAEYNTSRRGH